MIAGEKLKKRAMVCRDDCPVCKKARKNGKGFIYNLVKLEAKVCPWCKAYEEVYEKKAYM